MSASAYPLDWPLGWPRTPHYRRVSDSKFRGLTFSAARYRLQEEVRRLCGHEHRLVISTNLPVKSNGMPYAETRRVDDPGVAVYFLREGRPVAMARDLYLTVAGNLNSLALAIDHLRGLERHGGALMVDRAFEGFTALHAPGRVAPWREVFGFSPDVGVTLTDVEAAFLRLAKLRHPDVGGNDDAMAELNRARSDAYTELSP